MVYGMKLSDLEHWVRTKANYGDVAYARDRMTEKVYLYFYKGPDETPYWRAFSEGDFSSYLNLKKEYKEKASVEKKCENCKYFKGTSFNTKIQDYWCTHEKYSGTRIARHTSCPDFEEKEKKTTPFDGMKFYLKDINTGELNINYICEDCGKEMKEAPDRWWVVLPINKNAKKKPGYHFRCEECDKKKEYKI